MGGTLTEHTTCAYMHAHALLSRYWRGHTASKRSCDKLGLDEPGWLILASNISLATVYAARSMERAAEPICSSACRFSPLLGDVSV